MDLRVRRAGPQDAPAVARVHIASWRQTNRGLLPPGVAGLPLRRDSNHDLGEAFSQLPGKSISPAPLRATTCHLNAKPEAALSPVTGVEQRLGGEAFG